MSHTSSPGQPDCCVLIVEASAESREVFRTVLARRGLSTLDTADAQQGLLLADAHHPRVVVLDLDTADGDHDLLCGQYAASAQARGASLVVLGAIDAKARPGAERRVSKPYHYGPLIRTIEQLARRAETEARGASSPSLVR